MVTGRTDEGRMTPQAKLVFLVVIVLGLATLSISYIASQSATASKTALTRQDCRSLFAAPLTDATTKNTAADNEVRKGQVLAQYYGATDNRPLFEDAVELGFKGLEDQHTAQFLAHWYNDQYQALIRAQENDHDKFHEMCDAGPATPPKPPTYIPPPR